MSRYGPVCKLSVNSLMLSDNFWWQTDRQHGEISV